MNKQIDRVVVKRLVRYKNFIVFWIVTMELRQFKKVQLICCYLLSLAHESLGYDINFKFDTNHDNYSILNDELKNVSLGPYKTENLTFLTFLSSFGDNKLQQQLLL